MILKSRILKSNHAMMIVVLFFITEFILRAGSIRFASFHATKNVRVGL